MGISNCCQVNHKGEAKLVPFSTTNFSIKDDIKECIRSRVSNKQVVNTKLNQINCDTPDSDEDNKFMNNENEINFNDKIQDNSSCQINETNLNYQQNSKGIIMDNAYPYENETKLLEKIKTKNDQSVSNENNIDKNEYEVFSQEQKNKKIEIQNKNSIFNQGKNEKQKITIDDIIILSKFEKADNSQIIYEDELLKYKPGIQISYIPRFCQVTKDLFIYFKNKYSANCWLGKPIVTIPLRYVINIKK